LLPFAAEAKHGRRSQSWTCLCQRRLRRAWNGLPPIATGAEAPGERMSVLRFPCPRPSADEKRDGRATLRLLAGRKYRHELHDHYGWRELKANPSGLLEKYFDAFVYVANWGTHEFYIRLPQGSVDYELLEAMVPGESLRVGKTATFVIVEFAFESESDGEDDGTRWMASRIPLSSDLLRGDLRCVLSAASPCAGWRTRWR
jgi:hypothetical protein